jgi:ribosomal-protein-alanine N-acetyltransferase
MIIRPLEEKDIPYVEEIEKEAFGDRAWSASLFSDELKDASKHYLAAEKDGVLCGYGGFAHILDEAHIMNIAVDRACRRQRIGRQLLKALLQKAESLGIRAVTLEVSDNNTAAISLYESEGFALAGVRKDYYGKNEHARIYWRII